MRVSWSYAGNDILQLTYDGKNYELQLAGCLIEFIGYIFDTYNNTNNVYRLIIHTSPTDSFTATSGYAKVPVSSTWEFFCNGSGYSPTWKCTSHVLDYNDGGVTRFGYSTAGMSSTSWVASWEGKNLRSISPAKLRNSMGLGDSTSTLAIANGGTSITSNPSLLVNLESTAAATVF